MAINRIEDGDKHDRTPCFIGHQPTRGLFRDDFAARENGFIPTPTYPVTKSAPARMLCGTGGDDSIMLEAIMLLLGLAACALILIAFCGLDVFRIRSRWR
jgi:hypothetical protein